MNELLQELEKLRTETPSKLRDAGGLLELKRHARNFGIEVGRRRPGAWEKEIHLLLSARRHLAGQKWADESKRLLERWAGSRKVRLKELSSYLEDAAVKAWLDESAVERWAADSLRSIKSGNKVRFPKLAVDGTAVARETADPNASGQVPQFQMAFLEGMLEGIRIARSKGGNHGGK